MASTLDEVREQLEGLLFQVEADCAAAMEGAAMRASQQVKAEREALIRVGRLQERERTLLAIELVSEGLDEQGANVKALQTLRRYVIGDQ